jgi:hypothetical protein
MQRAQRHTHTHIHPCPPPLHAQAFVSYERATGRPRGFGFVVFEDPDVAERVVGLQHTIDRREVRGEERGGGGGVARRQTLSCSH